MPKKALMTVQRAEAMGLDALIFLAEDEARIGRFLALSGTGPDELRRAAGEPAMLAAVLDFLLADESLLLVFANSKGHAPEDVWPAQALLAGTADDGGS
jgi:hypothetical protein